MDFLKENIYTVFIEAETAGNIGFLARAMKNFGLHNLVLINPCELKEESYFQAMHAKELVYNAKFYPTLSEFLKTEKVDFVVGTSGVPGGSYNLARIPLKPEQLADAMRTKGKIAILFGREGNGLSNDEIDMCDILVSIPTDDEYPIMNISHAGAVIFYELFKNKHEFNVPGIEEASLSEKEYVTKEMTEMINKLSIPQHKKNNGIKTFKNILGRAFVTGREAHTLIGVFRRMNELIKK